MTSKDRERLILGGIGALIPSVCSLLVLDFHVFVKEGADLIGWLGYAIRVLVLFALGGFLAYIHKDEVNPWKIVQLGLGVPALALSIVNGANSAQHVATANAASNVPSSVVLAAVSSMSLISTANAQENSNIRSFTPKQQSVGSKLWRGFIGAPRKSVWFVITDSAPTLEKAQEKAEEINRRNINGIRAEVYQPVAGGKEFVVVVGRDLEQDAAQDLVAQFNKKMGNTKARIWSPTIP